jgi:hypothetical protein
MIEQFLLPPAQKTGRFFTMAKANETQVVGARPQNVEVGGPAVVVDRVRKMWRQNNRVLTECFQQSVNAPKDKNVGIEVQQAVDTKMRKDIAGGIRLHRGAQFENRVFEMKPPRVRYAQVLGEDELAPFACRVQEPLRAIHEHDNA